MPAPNPPSPPSASQRRMLTPLKQAASGSQSSAGRGRVSITMRGLTPARTSFPSGRVAGSKYVCDDDANSMRRSSRISDQHRARTITTRLTTIVVDDGSDALQLRALGGTRGDYRQYFLSDGSY